MIKVVEKNEGKKIPYEVSGNKLTFDDDLTINLAKRESDSAVHIDVCYDDDKNLVIGAPAGRRYIAEIDIPAREYDVKTVPNPDYKEGDVDGMMNPKTITERTPKAFNIDRVTLTLWGCG